MNHSDSNIDLNGDKENENTSNQTISRIPKIQLEYLANQPSNPHSKAFNLSHPDSKSSVLNSNEINFKKEIFITKTDTPLRDPNDIRLTTEVADEVVADKKTNVVSISKYSS